MSSAHPTPTPTASQKKHTSERTLPYNIQCAVSHPLVHLVILWCTHATNTHQALTKCEALPLVVRIQRKIRWKTNLAKIFHEVKVALSPFMKHFQSHFVIGIQLEAEFTLFPQFAAWAP